MKNPLGGARWRTLAYVCVAVSLASMIGVGLWGASRDLSQTRQTLTQSAVLRLLARASRRAGQLETALQQFAESRPGGDSLLSEFVNSAWMHRLWRDADRSLPGQLYEALVSPSGEVLLHTNPSFVGRSIGSRWYHRRALELAPDVYEIEASILDHDQSAFDVAIPLRTLGADGEEVAVFHEGLSKAWIEEQVSAHQSTTLRKWWIVSAASLVIFAAGMTSVYYLARQAAHLRQALQTAEGRRVTEIGRLAEGLAHEVRNPLHALRLNLNALKHAFRDDSPVSQEEQSRILEQSESEVLRVDELLRELLGYAKPERGVDDVVDLRAEVEGVVEFLRRDLEESDISIDLRLADKPLWANIDPARLRQVVMNLVLNARDALPRGGKVWVTAAARRNHIVLQVNDDGAGVPVDQRDKVFAPFFTSKAKGTGFGLAVVKRFIVDAGGDVQCIPHQPRGASFVITLPIARPRARRRIKK